MTCWWSSKEYVVALTKFNILVLKYSTKASVTTAQIDIELISIYLKK